MRAEYLQPDRLVRNSLIDSSHPVSLVLYFLPDQLKVREALPCTIRSHHMQSKLRAASQVPHIAEADKIGQQIADRLAEE